MDKKLFLSSMISSATIVRSLLRSTKDFLKSSSDMFTYDEI